MSASNLVRAVAVLACLAATPIAGVAATAAAAARFVVDAGPLDAALAQLAQQGSIDIGGTVAGLATVRTAGVKGRMPVARALAQLLRGTGYAAVPVGGGGFRIVAAAAAAPPARPWRRPRAAPAPVEAAVPTEVPDQPATITVTASKRDAGLLRFPGSVTIVQLDDSGRTATTDMHALASGLPILQSTDLGAGRNKLFIRGVADSSFVGPTRSTASVYFGDVQLGYGGPDPNLNLYDVERVEVLEGPQGALYGAGSIGGIVRLSPHAPQLDRIAARATASASATQDGKPGYDLAAMVNLPLVSDVVALRLVGYHAREGGYIDDLRRGRSDINSVVTSGGRLALRVEPGDGWTIDLGAVTQTIDAPDSQYALLSLPPLNRRSAIAQPFEDDFLLGRAVITKDWDSGLKLVSATGLIDHHSDDRYDATRTVRPDVPLAYDTRDRNRLITHETRLSRVLPDGAGWLVGASLIDDDARIERTFGPLGAPRDITGVTNHAFDLSAFGELTYALGPDLRLTGGARATWTRVDSDPSFSRADNKFVRGRRNLRLSPTVAMDWLIAPSLAWFARYGEGFRTGGLAVAPGVGRVANYDPDVIRVGETGVRLERRGATGIAGSASLSYARWSRIQADLIDRNGFPFTTNIGKGRIAGLEAVLDWVPVVGLRLTTSMFINKSDLDEPITALSRQDGDMLPDTPKVSFAGSADYRWAAGRDASFNVAAQARYTGRSVAGVGPMLDLKQGNYAEIDVSAGWTRHPVGLTIGIDNIANARGNRFALGNPFAVLARDQTTPLRPRTLRAGVNLDW
ncbi:TonB-dependent receptor domain-containing protein [Glacieibacterium sp.]|uniref:TonB-dependent receptor domain-containing protein n=1 Tax=Glacieibacterium sp. TaxID=2860237 RepID=UPI003B00B965